MFACGPNNSWLKNKISDRENTNTESIEQEEDNMQSKENFFLRHEKQISSRKQGYTENCYSHVGVLGKRTIFFFLAVK